MVTDYASSLNPEKALIWRIVHRDNLPWILEGSGVLQRDNEEIVILVSSLHRIAKQGWPFCFY
jgi:hypothetical protein